MYITFLPNVERMTNRIQPDSIPRTHEELDKIISLEISEIIGSSVKECEEISREDLMRICNKAIPQNIPFKKVNGDDYAGTQKFDYRGTVSVNDRFPNKGMAVYSIANKAVVLIPESLISIDGGHCYSNIHLKMTVYKF